MIGFLSELIFNLIKCPLFFLHKRNGYSKEAFLAKCGDLEKKFNPEDFVIMFHGVSVGEINAIEKLVKRTREEFKDAKIIITTGTNTGQDNAVKKLGEFVDYITYFPFDTPSCVKKFLNKIKPNLVFMAETEIWPNFGILCKKLGVKLYIINGRISDRTYKSYKILKFLFKYLLKNYSGVYTQSTEDLNKFLSIGSNPEITKRMNNLKFDITPPVVDFDFDTNGRLLLGASTHAGEEQIIVDVYKNLKSRYSDLKLMIAPRHLNHNEEIELIVKKSGLDYGFRSDNANFIDKDVIILDTMGELGKMFKFAYLSFIGGSFNTTGGHNPLESIIFARPVISGKCINNFKDIYAIIQNAKAGFVVNSKEEFIKVADKLLADNEFYNETSASCKKVFQEQQGALDFVINVIKANNNL